MTALRRVYPQDVFPGVWDKVSQLADDGVLISVEDIYEELRVQDDEVLQWAKEHSAIFVPLDDRIQLKVREILHSHIGLLDHRRRQSSADPFLIALAIVRSCTVVTEEKPSGAGQRPKIPNVCRDYGVKCITLLDMLRAEKLRLAL